LHIDSTSAFTLNLKTNLRNVVHTKKTLEKLRILNATFARKEFSKQ
jgi:hypothetical protein